MLDSFDKTAGKWTRLCICLDYDDENFWEYYKLVKDHMIVIDRKRPITEIFNNVFKKFNEFGWYSCGNDDFVYRTEGWDEKLRVNGISYGDDGFHGEEVAVTSIIRGDLPRALGWLQMPKLIHLYGDLVWQDIGKALGNLYYFKDVYIEHKHFMNGKAEKDKVYERTNSVEMYRGDLIQYAIWKTQRSSKDIQTIKEHLHEKRSRL